MILDYSLRTTPGENHKVADVTVFLEVTLNNRQINLIGEFTQRGSALLATRGELRRLGIQWPGDENSLVPLTAFAKDVQVDERAQTVSLLVPSNALIASIVETQTISAADFPFSESTAGAVLNYDVLTTQTEGVQVTGGLFDGRVYRGASVLSTSALGYLGDVAKKSIRLDSTYTVSLPDTLQRYKAGDFVTSGLSWTRPVRLGGLQLATDFALRPDLVTAPVPSVRGETTVPSTVDLFVNGIRQLSQNVEPGPFEIRQPPIAAGVGNVGVVVTDALGRQTFQTLPFYASSALLSPGLSAYAVETGWLRRSYGIESNDYGKPAMTSSVRYGLKPSLTLEGHAEAAKGLRLAGAGAVTKLGEWGLVSGAIATSNSDKGTDSQYRLGFERLSQVASLSLATTLAGSNYRDIGALDGSPIPRWTTTASTSLYSLNKGSINLAYTATHVDAFSIGGATFSPVDVRVVSATYFKSFFNRFNFFVTGSRNLQGGNTNVVFGVVIPLNAKDVVSSNVSVNGDMRTASVQAARPAVVPGDFGWQLQDTEGSYTQRLVQADYKGNSAQGSVAVSQLNNINSARAGVRGAVIFADDKFFLANTIDDSFAVVSTNSMPGIGVYVDNRFSGKTDDDGRLLVPNLRAYDLNKVSLDVFDMPVDTNIQVTEKIVKPRDRSGVIVGFDPKQTFSARVILFDDKGHPLPVGSVATLRKTGKATPIGYDGETYMTEMSATNNVDVALPAGKSCQTSFAFSPRQNTIQVVGPLTCQ